MISDGPLQRFPIINRLPSSLRLTILLLLITEIPTLGMIFGIAMGKIPPIRAETYISNTVVIIYTTLTVTYLWYSFSPSWYEWINGNKLLGGEEEKKKVLAKLNGAKHWGFGLVPIIFAVSIWLLRFFITGLSAYPDDPSVIHDFAAIVLIQLSIWYLLFSNFVTSHYIARSPLRIETLSDYKNYAKLNGRIVTLTILFAFNAGYYGGTLITWSMFTNHYLWTLFILGVMISAILFFFLSGLFELRKGIGSSKKEDLSKLNDLLKRVKSEYKYLDVEQQQEMVPFLKTKNPSELLYVGRVESAIAQHEKVGVRGLLGYDTLAKIIASVAVAVFTVYILPWISHIATML